MRPRARPEAPDALARALGRAGVMPADEAEAAVRAGRVSIDGKTVREPLTVVRVGDSVRVDGHDVSLRARTLAVMLHKEAGFVTTARDERGRPTVFDALRAALPRELQGYAWHAVGRLDLDTTGLLLFTNDEALVAHGTSPATKLPKRYVARVQGAPTDAALAPLRRGLRLGDEAARPAEARVREPGVVELTVTEGRFHQVKRMLGAVGLPVLSLHREAIGGVTLDVPPGKSRRLADAEVSGGLGYEPKTFHG